MTSDPNDLEDIPQDQVELSEEAQAVDTAGDASPETLADEIERLKDELTQSKEQTLRAHAETQNARRRAQQDVEKAHKFSLEKFVNDMLPVADNLERAIESAKEQEDGAAAILEGVELTLKTLLDGLKRHQVEAVDPVGEPFDPQLHQAMSIVENAEAEPNTVLTVFQKGYTLSGRLVRPAMVVVSK